MAVGMFKLRLDYGTRLFFCQAIGIPLSTGVAQVANSVSDPAMPPNQLQVVNRHPPCAAGQNSSNPHRAAHLEGET